VSARIQCPQCQAAFAFSPALVGKMVRCKKCQHTFAVIAPPGEAEPAAAAPESPKPPAPPPLPPARARRAEPDDADDPPARRRSDSDRPRRRPEPVERSSGVMLLTLLIVGAGLGFLVLAVGIGFILWPSSTPDPSVANLPPASQPTAPARVEPPPRMPPPPPVEPAPRAPAPAVTPRAAGTPAPAVTGPPAFTPADPGRVKGTPPRFPDPPPPVGRAEVKPPRDKPGPKWHPVAALPIKPAPLKQDREERKLPSAIDDVCVGGGGRFLLLSLPQPKQVAIFDVSEAKVVKFLSVPSASPRIAAGMDKLFVADPAEGLIVRYNLLTFEKEITVQLPPAPAGGKVDALVTGSAANGPILVGYSARERSGGSGVLVDPVTFKEVAVEFPNGARFPTFTPYLARASADGRTFVIHDGHGGEPHTLNVITLNGSSGKVSGEVRSAPASLGNPSPDGSLIYTAHGVFNPDLRDVTGGKRYSALPARHGQLSVRLEPAGDPYAIKRPSKGSSTGGSTVSFHFPKDDRPIGKLTNVEGIHHEGIAYGSSQDKINHDKRVHWIPDGKVLVTIPATSDRLLLYRFDPDEALAKSEIDYLYVTSTPVAVAVKGDTYVYPVVVKSKKGGVKIKLESGPDGMKVGADGRITWAVPKDFGQTEADVLLTVGDATGQEIFHSFRVAVRNRAEVPG
jgi:predicted Zn finger-like uncharacterized protein